MNNSNTIDIKKIIKALSGLDESSKVSKDVILEALADAIKKAYEKQINKASDEDKAKHNLKLNLDCVINENDKKNPIALYQLLEVVESDEDVEDADLQVGLQEALTYDKTAKVGDTVRKLCDFGEFNRATAVQVKSNLKQKIRETEKAMVYEAYKDKVGDLVSGVIQEIVVETKGPHRGERKYAIVNLGNALAMMPKVAQLPTETYREGQTIRVVITKCEKDAKNGGSQLLVSRADALLVKRLFERDVPEIYQGIVEIKAIAREAGDRTKMAVISHNPDVDPIGTCVGLQGVRVNEISAEIKGERIDIFQYSDNITEFVTNALKPAEIITAVPSEDKKSIIVVVDESQLSLAIGRQGKNVRLVAKLTGKKVDIKTDEQLLDEGIDYRVLLEQYQVDLEKERRQKKSDEINKLAAEAEARQAARAASEEDLPKDELRELIGESNADEALNSEVETVEEVVSMSAVEENSVDQPIDQVEETKEEEVVDNTNPQEEAVKEVEVKKKKKTRTLKERSEYVSKFETFADSSKSTQDEATPKRRKRKNDEVERKQSNAELVKNKEYSLKPFYTEEELAEIEEQQLAEEEDYIDYDDYAEYYEDDQD